MSEGNAAQRMMLSRWPKGMTLGDVDKEIKAGRMCARCLKAGPTKEVSCSCGELSANVCDGCEGAEDLFSPCEDEWGTKEGAAS